MRDAALRWNPHETHEEIMDGQGGYTIREITGADIPVARALMIRTFEEDFGSGYDPEYHGDVDDIRGTYIERPRHVLYVAIDDTSGELVGTAGVKGGALRRGPEDLVRRYDDRDTAQIVRVYVRREDRRRGIARALLGRVLEFIVADGGYTTVALHTFPHSPGALAFWSSIATPIIGYEREGQFPEVFFEIPLDVARSLAASPA